MTEYIFLGFLMERDMTGYDIKHHMSISTSYFMDASFGSIYPSLKRLEKKGFVEVKEIVENMKLKKIYSINERGKQEFLEWLALPITISKNDVSPALIKIFFFRYLSEEKVKQVIEQLIQDIESNRKNLLKLEGEIGDQMNPYERYTLQFGLDSYDFVLRWCKEKFMK